MVKKQKIAIILEAAGSAERFGSNKLLLPLSDGIPMVLHIIDTVRALADNSDDPSYAAVGNEVPHAAVGNEVPHAAVGIEVPHAAVGIEVPHAAVGIEVPHAAVGNEVPHAVVGNCKIKKILVTQYKEIVDLAPDYEVVINENPQLGISRTMQLGIASAADADAYMFCVCDQPYLKVSTLEKLIRAYETSDAGIVSLSRNGEMSNPKIFSSKYRDELMSLSGDTGGRQIIAAHEDDLLLVEAGSDEEVADIDMPDDISSLFPAHLK